MMWLLLLTVFQDATMPHLLRLGLKCLPLISSRIAYCVLGMFTHQADADHQALLQSGRAQWSKLLEIIVFVMSLGADVAIVSSELESLDHDTRGGTFAWVAVLTICLVFLGAAMCACWSHVHARE